MTTEYVRGIVMGRTSFTLNTAKLLAGTGLPVQLWETGPQPGSALATAARRGGLPYRRLADSGEITQALMALADQKTLILSAANFYLYPADIVSNPFFTIINYHNAMLPRHRGMNAEAWQIFEQDTEAGVSWHRADAGVDTGDLLIQQRIPLTGVETSLSLLAAQGVQALSLLEGLLPKLLAGNAVYSSQSPLAGDRAWRATEKPADGRLDFAWPLKKISAFLRAMDYGPLAVLGKPEVYWEEQRLRWRHYALEGLPGPGGEFPTQQVVQVGKNLYLEGTGAAITLKAVSFIPENEE